MAKKKLIELYHILKPGECPHCHKGPIAIMVRDTYPVVIDQDGYAITLGDVTNSANGICVNCGHKLGEYELNVFKWYPVKYPYRDKIPKVKPTVNFFGNTGETKAFYDENV